MELNYNIISSSSDGNAILINDKVLIDCGVSYTKLKPFVKEIRVILLTHL